MQVLRRENRNRREPSWLPGTALDIPLYWAHPRSAQAALARLTGCVMGAARRWLILEKL